MRRFLCYIVLIFMTAQTMFVAADVHSIHQEHGTETHQQIADFKSDSGDFDDSSSPSPVSGNPACAHCCHCHGHFAKLSVHPAMHMPMNGFSSADVDDQADYFFPAFAPGLRPPII